MFFATLRVYAINVLGFTLGLAAAIACILLWMSLAVSVLEWILENTYDRIKGDRQDVDVTDSGLQEILVSDLHIDTWNARDVAGRGKQFENFLDTVRNNPKLNGFILNGDVIDIPTFAGNYAPGSEDLLLPLGGNDPPNLGLIPNRVDHLLASLFSLVTTNATITEIPGLDRVVFQTGNHDMGMQGIRFKRQSSKTQRVAWNPQIVVKESADRNSAYKHWLYLEHGHHYDPFLWLYARYALLDITRGGNLQNDAAFLRGMQRNGVKGMGRHKYGTVERSPAIHNVSDSRSLESGDAVCNDERWDFAKVKRTPTEWLVVYRYRYAARKAFGALSKGSRPGGVHSASVIDTSSVKTVTFGHIHLPDRYVFPGRKVYINSGDWCGNTPHQCYSIVQSDGTMLGPFQWQGAAHAIARHSWRNTNPEASIEA